MQGAVRLCARRKFFFGGGKQPASLALGWMDVKKTNTTLLDWLLQQDMRARSQKYRSVMRVEPINELMTTSKPAS